MPEVTTQSHTLQHASYVCALGRSGYDFKPICFHSDCLTFVRADWVTLVTLLSCKDKAILPTVPEFYSTGKQGLMKSG